MKTIIYTIFFALISLSAQAFVTDLHCYRQLDRKAEMFVHFDYKSASITWHSDEKPELQQYTAEITPMQERDDYVAYFVNTLNQKLLIARPLYDGDYRAGMARLGEGSLAIYNCQVAQ